MKVVTKPDKLRTSVLHGHKQLLMEKNTASYQTIVIELENLFISYGHNTGKKLLSSAIIHYPPRLALWVSLVTLMGQDVSFMSCEHGSRFLYRHWLMNTLD